MKHLFKYIYTFALLSLSPLLSKAQPAGELTLSVSAEGAAGSGDFTPYYLLANRHGILSNEKNTGYLRAAADYSLSLGATRLWAVADLQLQKDDYSRAYLQQAAVGASWKYACISAGAWEQEPVLRDRQLSSGSMVWSGNCRPIPQVRVGTSGFIDFPWTRQWLQVYFDISYGRFTDDDWLDRRFGEFMDYYAARGIDMHNRANAYMTNKIFYHEKQIFFRTNPAKMFVATVGLEHAVQFGGTTYNNPESKYRTFSADVEFKDFFKVLMPRSGDENDLAGDANFSYGNHLGSLDAMITYNQEDFYEDRYAWSVSAYLENYFDDGSGMAKRNGWDGLWGLEWKSVTPAWVDAVVAEYLQTTDQSGPLHWAPSDFSSDVASRLPHEARGGDNYYNNFFYAGYAHRGQAIGTPMLKSPFYNSDCYLAFTDTRVQAFHLGLRGHIRPVTGLSYRVLFSQRTSWGTPFISSPHRMHSTNLLVEAGWLWKFRPQQQFRFSAAFAMDYGSLYGNNTAVDLRISYTFRHLFNSRDRHNNSR